MARIRTLDIEHVSQSGDAAFTGADAAISGASTEGVVASSLARAIGAAGRDRTVFQTTAHAISASAATNQGLLRSFRIEQGVADAEV